MGRFDGKVALITGAARGQGRSHAVRMAEEGADIVAIDRCQDFDTVAYSQATQSDLDQTAKQIESVGRRCLAYRADVRDLPAMQSIVADAVDQLGGLDIVCVNAGILTVGWLWELDEATWDEMIDVNLTGAWKTLKAVVPPMIERNRGGSIILTSSICGLAALPQIGHYNASKHGVTGLMRSLAVELAPYGIRVNTVNPSTADTPMVANQPMYDLFGGKEGATREEVERNMLNNHAFRIPWIEIKDITNAVLYLASDESRYVTGTDTVVDGGGLLPYRLPHV